MEGINAVITQNLGTIVLALAGVVGLQLILLMVALAKAGGLKKRLQVALAGTEGKSLEGVLAQQHQQVAAALQGEQELNRRTRQLEAQLQLAVQRVGIVRFNAYPDMGSELSYSVALLNERADGVVFTGMTGRDDFRAYAKQITAGKSAQQLSKEEQSALAQASGR